MWTIFILLSNTHNSWLCLALSQDSSIIVTLGYDPMFVCFLPSPVGLLAEADEKLVDLNQKLKEEASKKGDKTVNALNEELCTLKSLYKAKEKENERNCQEVRRLESEYYLDFQRTCHKSIVSITFRKMRHSSQL